LVGLQHQELQETNAEIDLFGVAPENFAVRGSKGSGCGV